MDANDKKHDRVTLDQFIALNEEIAALVRAGVPLESGLAAIAEELPGRAGKLASRIAARMERGENLADAVAGEGNDLPGIYPALIEAGIRSGRLAVALEGMTKTARHVAELRSFTGYALCYPVLVVVVALIGLRFFVEKLEPGYRALAPEPDVLPSWFGALRDSAPIWGPLLPGLLLAALAAWWISSGRATTLAGRSLLAWLPSRKKLTHCGRAATFCDVFALLIEHRVPLADALRLSAAASGDAAIESAGNELSAKISQGQRLPDAMRSTSGVPSRLAWVLQTAATPEALTRGAANTAALYRRQAERIADAVQIQLPVVLLLVLGAAATLSYMLLVYYPYIAILRELSAL